MCANTGDSRAVLARGGQAVTLSNDHKPYLPGEKERIEKAGGQVKFNRVNGDLAVSRALGDFVYKRCESVAFKEQAVTAFPEIIVEEREESDQFIVLACDGIWDVMSSQEVVEKVRWAPRACMHACLGPRALLPPPHPSNFGLHTLPAPRVFGAPPPVFPRDAHLGTPPSPPPAGSRLSA